MKKLYILLLLAFLPLIVNAEAIEIDGIWYNLVNAHKTAEVTSNPKSYSGEIIIPSKITYVGTEYSITSIGEGAFGKCDGLTSVTIPNSITSIGKGAFSGCGITSLNIPNSVISIGEQAFSSLINLNSITVEAGNSQYDSRDKCNAIIETSTNSLLFGCSKTTIPNSVTSIGDWAFQDCLDLASITIPNSAISIGEGAFYGCIKLKNIIIPNNMTTIGNGAFSHCSDLVSVTIPNSVLFIGNQAFAGCSSLTSIIIPSSVTSIGNGAFAGCNLSSVTIPNSVTFIGNGAFSGCDGLTIETGNKNYDSRDNCNAIIESAKNILISGCTNTSIPNSVTSIGDGAFSGCNGLTSLTIPNSVTCIGERAFEGCLYLTSVYISNSITSIGNWTFSACYYLPSITIPNSVTSIGSNAFFYCPNLTTVTIGTGITWIDNQAFDYCEKLIDIYCLAEEAPKTPDYGTISSSINNITLHVPAGCINAYKEYPWNQFKNIVEITEDTGIKLLSKESPFSSIDYFTINGDRLDQPKRGINIIRSKNGTTKKILTK